MWFLQINLRINFIHYTYFMRSLSYLARSSSLFSLLYFLSYLTWLPVKCTESYFSAWNFFSCIYLAIKFFFKKLFLRIWGKYSVFVFGWFSTENENSSHVKLFHLFFSTNPNKCYFFSFNQINVDEKLAFYTNRTLQNIKTFFPPNFFSKENYFLRFDIPPLDVIFKSWFFSLECLLLFLLNYLSTSITFILE